MAQTKEVLDFFSTLSEELLTKGYQADNTEHVINLLENRLGESLSTFLDNPDADHNTAKGLIKETAFSMAESVSPYGSLSSSPKAHAVYDMLTTRCFNDDFFNSFNDALTGDANFYAIKEELFDIKFEISDELINLFQRAVPWLEAEMENSYKRPETPDNPEHKTRTSNRFAYHAPKTKGIEKGLIAIKKRDETDPKYNQRYSIKAPSIGECVREKLASDIARYFIKERAPKIRLVHNADRSNIVISSRYINQFSDLDQHLNPNKSLSKKKIHHKAFSEMPGIWNILALNLLIGNTDIHKGNMGIVRNKEGPQDMAIIDFGRTLNFRSGQSPRFDLLAGVSFGRSLEPLDIIRGLHNGPNEIPANLMLNEHFAEALHNLADRITQEESNIRGVITSGTRAAQHSLTQLQNEELKASLPHTYHCISPETTIDNLGNELSNAIFQQGQHLKTLAKQIELQLILDKGTTKQLQYFLTENPTFLNKEITFLPHKNNEDFPSPRTILSYAQSQQLSAKKIDVIQQAMGLPRIKDQLPSRSEDASNLQKDIVSKPIVPRKSWARKEIDRRASSHSSDKGINSQ